MNIHPPSLRPPTRPPPCWVHPLTLDLGGGRRHGGGRHVARLLDEAVEDGAQLPEVGRVVHRRFAFRRQRRDPAQLVDVNLVGDANRQDLHPVRLGDGGVRHRQVGVARRHAVGDDDRDVVDVASVAVPLVEDHLVHLPQPAGRVRVAALVRDAGDRVDDGPLAVVLVQLELDGAMVGELDEGDARLMLADVQSSDDVLHEVLHQVEVARVGVVDRAGRIDDKRDVGL